MVLNLVGGVMIKPKQIGIFRGRNELILDGQNMVLPVSGFTEETMTL